MKLDLEEIKNLLFSLIEENKLVILPLSKDESQTDYPRPVTPSGIGINDEGTHILIVVHPENKEPNFILPDNKDKKTIMN